MISVAEGSVRLGELACPGAVEVSTPAVPDVWPVRADAGPAAVDTVAMDVDVSDWSLFVAAVLSALSSF